MCRVRTAGPLHAPKLFEVKLYLMTMRQTDHNNGILLLLLMFWPLLVQKHDSFCQFSVRRLVFE